MAYLKTVIKRLVVALCVLVLTGYVHACWVLARKLGEHEQVRMRPPSMRAYAQSTQHACVRPARRTGPERLRPPSMRAYAQRGAPDQGGMRPPSEAHSCAHHTHSTHPVVVAAERRQLGFQRHGRTPTYSQSR